MRMTRTPQGASDARTALPGDSLEARLRDATDTLEAVAGNHALLDALDGATRERLHRALAALHAPVDPVARRQRRKQQKRSRVLEKNAHDDALLDATRSIASPASTGILATPSTWLPLWM